MENQTDVIACIHVCIYICIIYRWDEWIPKKKKCDAMQYKKFDIVFFVDMFSLFCHSAEVVSILLLNQSEQRPREMVGFQFDICRFHDIFRCSDTNNNMTKHWSLYLSQRGVGETRQTETDFCQTWLHNMSCSNSQLQTHWHRTGSFSPFIISKLILITWREIMTKPNHRLLLLAQQ